MLSTNKGAEEKNKGARLLELSFSALSPGGTEVARKALVASYQVSESSKSPRASRYLLE